MQHLHRHVQPRAALLHPSGQHAAEVGVVFHDGGHHAERCVRGDGRRGHVAHDKIEQRRQVLAGAVQRGVGPALPAGRVEHREVELRLGGSQRGEQVEDFGMHFVRAGIGAVHLVDHDDRRQAAGQRLADHELGLRQHALGCVHQDERAVHHVQDALHLAAEISVAGRIDDVDPRAAPDHRGALGQDGDAALALQDVAVHRPLGHHLMVAERAGLAEQLVDQGGFAMVNMGDDRDVANLHDVPGGAGMLRCTHSPWRPDVRGRMCGGAIDAPASSRPKRSEEPGPSRQACGRPELPGRLQGGPVAGAASRGGAAGHPGSAQSVWSPEPKGNSRLFRLPRKPARFPP